MSEQQKPTSRKNKKYGTKIKSRLDTEKGNKGGQVDISEIIKRNATVDLNDYKMD